MKQTIIRIIATALLLCVVGTMGLTACQSREAPEANTNATSAPGTGYADTEWENTTSVSGEEHPETELVPEIPPYDGSPVRRLSVFEYPEYIARPDGADYGYERLDEYNEALDRWRAAYNERKSRFDPMSEGLDAYLKTSISTFAGNTEGKNKVVSPISIYLALGMLAECTDRSTRAQILDTLGAESIDELREDCSDIWSTLYRNDKTVSVLLGNSIWMSDNEDYKYDEKVLASLTQNHSASAFTGDISSKEYLELYKDWLNENTGGLLEKYVAESEFDPNLVMRLVNTVYFKARWHAFSEANTEKKTFYTDGGEVICDFMHTRLQGYYYGDSFAAVKLGFTDGAYSMWFILPDEGHTVDEIMSDPQALELILHGRTAENFRQDLYVNLSLPRFDISSELDLIGGLEAMGITEAFDWTRSDFCLLKNEDIPLYVNSASHKARLKIDEEGCEGAAYTEIDIASGSAAPEELDEIDLVFDRPFAVAVVSEHDFYNSYRTDNLPVFVGVINDPTEK